MIRIIAGNNVSDQEPESVGDRTTTSVVKTTEGGKFLHCFRNPEVAVTCLHVALVPIPGILVSVLWHRIIKSHKDLNTVKFKIIHELEQRLPVALYTYEWRLAEEGRGKPYLPVTNIERWVPLAFLALHLALLVVLATNGLPTWSA